MSKVLGKRKARDAEARGPAVDLDDAQTIFRRHFEAQFKPLDVAPIHPPPAIDGDSDHDTDSEESESEWEGISEDEEDEVAGRVEVVDHASAQKPISSMSKTELKKFMSSRPPGSEFSSSNPTAKSHSTTTPTTEDEDAPSLLANDLALRRLLSESRLLSRATPNPMFYPAGTGAATADPSAKPFAAGRLRLAMTDLRVRALGARDSVFAQPNVPMAIRKGVAAAAAGREARRRREARENGVVLEREEKRDSRKRRGGGRGGGGGGHGGSVDLPAVGRMRGAELRISKRDVMSIQGSDGGGFGRGGNGRGGKGRGKGRGGRTRRP